MVQNLNIWKSAFSALFPSSVVAFYTGNQRSYFFHFCREITHTDMQIRCISLPLHVLKKWWHREHTASSLDYILRMTFPFEPILFPDDNLSNGKSIGIDNG